MESRVPTQMALELNPDAFYGYRIEFHTGQPALDRHSGEGTMIVFISQFHHVNTCKY